MNAFRRAAASLLSAGLLGTAAWAGFSTPASAAITDVVVNEADSQDAAGGEDWIELYNKGTEVVDLSGLVLKDATDKDPYVIPQGTTIAPGAHLVFEGKATFQFGLGKDDAARLMAADGTTVISQISWGPHATNTWGLCPDGVGAVVDTAAPTKGAANQCTKPTGKVVINEIESQAGQPDDWIELKNVGDAPIDLTGYVMTDNSVDHRYNFPDRTVIQPGEYLTIDVATVAGGFGLGGADSVILYAPDGSIVDQFSWTAHSATSLGRCADGIGAITDTAAPTKNAANSCTVPVVKVNEIKSTGGGADAIELYNPGTSAIDLSGYVVKDNDDTRTDKLPAGTVIEAGGYLVLSEGTHFTFGLGNGDSARLFMADGVTLVDGHTYPAHGDPSWGRCPSGTGDFVVQTTLTLGAANDCGTTSPSPSPTEPTPTTPALPTVPWPGSQTVTPADLLFLEDSSGLDFQFVDGQGVLWAIDNGTGTLWKLDVATDGTLSFAAGWEQGKQVRFADDASTAKGPDSEGVTVADNGMVYIASERDNSDKSINENKILMVDPNASGSQLVAKQTWDITSALPAVTANTGIEAIQYVPDTALAGKLWDSNTGAPYDPATYPNHGDGLFFVAVEDNGTVYAFSLNPDGTYQLVTEFTPGLGGVMALDWDPVLGVLWTMCDDGCENTGAQVTFNGTSQPGVTLVTKPDGLPVLNFEGFATSTEEMCVDGQRPVWWFQDGAKTGALSVGSLPCVLPPSPTAEPTTTSAPTTSAPTTSAPTTSAPTESSATPSASTTDEPNDGGNLPQTGSEGAGALVTLGMLAAAAAAVVMRRR